MMHTYHVKVLVTDIENIYVQAKNEQEARSIAIAKISDPNSNVYKDNLNDYTESNSKLKVISTKKVEEYEIN
tara:strand:+ start:547 stop:762 length:216 start_codon:yes stop_codon:yes gene_type:complete